MTRAPHCHALSHPSLRCRHDMQLSCARTLVVHSCVGLGAAAAAVAAEGEEVLLLTAAVAALATFLSVYFLVFCLCSWTFLTVAFNCSFLMRLSFRFIILMPIALALFFKSSALRCPSIFSCNDKTFSHFPLSFF